MIIIFSWMRASFPPVHEGLTDVQRRKPGQSPLVISMSLSFTLLMWFPGLNPGCPWDPLTWSGFIECLLCVDYDKARHCNSAYVTSLWWNRKSVYRVCNSLTKPESSMLKNANRKWCNIGVIVYSALQEELFMKLASFLSRVWVTSVRESFLRLD